MKQAHVLYQMVRADFLERVRRYSFLLTLGFALYLAYQTFIGHIILQLGEYVGVENSAWFGAKMTLVTTTFLTLVGFYVVRNSVQRDEQTRVGRILASTPMSSVFYTLAKTLSNLAVLVAMVASLALSAIAMQMLQGHDGLHLWPLLAPFLFIALPAMAITAATAILFETAPVLRTGAGNVIYFFVWAFSLTSAAVQKLPDPTGIRLFIHHMGSTILRTDPAWKQSFTFSLGGNTQRDASKLFLWQGVPWGASDVAERFGYLLLAFALSALAAAFFHRFDPSRERSKVTKANAEADVAVPAGIVVSNWGHAHLTPLPSQARRSRFFDLVGCELRMLLKGKPWWWQAIAAGLILVPYFCPTSAVTGVTMAALLFPVLLWSQLGSRESRHATSPFVFACPDPLLAQLPATWIAGVILTALFTSGYAVRVLAHSSASVFMAWLACVLFIPSLAMFLGAWSGGTKAFEAIYTVWWYVGIANHVPGADFLGLTEASRSPFLYLVLAAVMLISAFAARRARLAYA